MKINEIITEALNSNTALNTIRTAAKELSGIVNSANSELDDALKWNDPGRVLPVTSGVTKWFTNNYLSSRKGGGYNLQSALQSLKGEKVFSELASDALGDIQFFAAKNKRDLRDPSAKKSNMQHLDKLSNTFVDILKKAPSTHLKGDYSREDILIAKNLKIALGAFKGKMSELRQTKMKDRGIDPKAVAAKQKDKGEKQLRGKQTNQAEQIVNQVLSTLPKEQAAGIRQAIARADNKLLALQSEMKKRGLAESIKFLKSLLT